jgi:cardiolipin synthase
MADHSAQPAAGKPITAEIAGNRLQLIESGVERFEMLLSLIAGAQKSIKMLMYMFNPDKDGDAVRTALTEAAHRGVRVKLLIDGFGSAATPKFFADLAEAGGQYCVFNPSWGRRYLLRNHQKLIVVDGEAVLIGGANIDATYLEDRGASHWRDLWLRLDGPEAALPGRYFDGLFRWSKRPNAKLRSLKRMCAEFTEWRGPLQWKFSGPLSMRNSWWRSIGRDMKRARRLDMIFAYFAPPSAMIRRIGRVGRRGRAWSDDRRSSAQLQPAHPSSRRDLRISAGEASHQARAGRRRRPHRLVELRLPELLHQSGDHAADQGCGIRRGDARLFRGRARRLPLDHSRTA